jgi:GWxTD domain-containing protein
MWKIAILGIALTLIDCVFAQDDPLRPPASPNAKNHIISGLCSEATSEICDPRDKACVARKKSLRRTAIQHFGERKGWLDQDVRWIITDEERAAFKKLANDEERDQFVEQFWLRRDPTPDTIENEFEEEHYRRMMYANEHFGFGIPGWKSDRGRSYVVYGPPDEVKAGIEKVSDGHGRDAEYPKETWRYNSKTGNLAAATELKFVDTCRCNDYSLTFGREEIDRMLTNMGPPQSPVLSQPTLQGIQVFVGPVKAPEVRFKDLEELITIKITINLLPFTLTSDSFRITDWTDWVPVTIRYNGKDLQWKKDGEKRKATLRLFTRVTTLTNHVAEIFEDEINLTEAASVSTDKFYDYSRSVPFHSGLYHLDLALQDVATGHVGTRSQTLHVPDYGDGTHISSIVLSKSPSEPIFNAAHEQSTFARTEPVYLFAQAYRLGIHERTEQSDASVDYEVFSRSGKKTVSILHLTDSAATLNQHGEQLSLQKELFSGTWKPGNYDLVLKVRDNITHQELCAEQPFTLY